jgi:hypothetical protein
MKLIAHPAFIPALVLLAMRASGQNLPPPEDPPQGTQIAWASEAFSLNLMADGVTTFENSGEDIRFDLGTFAPGFDPTTATPDQWTASWIVLQGADYDLVDQQFINTATLYDNLGGFAVGGKAFIWGYNTMDIEEGTQWILIAADQWSWPSFDSMLPTTFSLSSDTAPSSAILGSVNDSSTGSLMRLESVYPLVVPEPSAAVLGMLGALMLLRRRRSL